jgi:hypothetical protein
MSLARNTYWIVGTLKIKVEMMNEYILKIIIFLLNLIYLQMTIILTKIDDCTFILWCLMIMNATSMWILKNTLTIVFQCVDNSSAWSQSKMHFTKPKFGHHFFHGIAFGNDEWKDTWTSTTTNGKKQTHMLATKVAKQISAKTSFIVWWHQGMSTIPKFPLQYPRLNI